MTGGDDIAVLDRSYSRLMSFLRSCPDPTVRALTLARFLLEVAARQFTGRSYYFESLGPELLAAVRSPAFDAPDPELLAVTRAGLATLGPEGDAAGAAIGNVQGRPARYSGSLTESVAASGQFGVCATAQVSVPVFLRCPPPSPEASATDLAVLASLSVTPRPLDKGHRDLRWASHPDAADDPLLRPLHAVARDALEAARHAVPLSGGPGFDLDVSGVAAPVAGDSAGLALALAMAGAMIAAKQVGGITRQWSHRARSLRSTTYGPAGVAGLRPRQDLAWTGRMLADGTVATVDPDSLRAKVRAAYFRGMAGIVVPAVQGNAARAHLPADPLVWGSQGQQADAPFTVYAVSSLAGALASAGLVEPWALPLDALRTPWHRRRVTLRWVVASLAVAILALIAVFVLPSMVWRRGPHASIVDGAKAVRVMFDGGARSLVIRPTGLAQYAEIGHRLPGDPAGAERVVILADASDSTAATLTVHELRHGRAIWHYSFDSSNLPFEPLEKHPEGRYAAKTAVIADLDGDGDSEVVVSLTVHPSSWCLLHLLDDDAQLAGTVIHRGHVERFLSIDLTGDGAPELVGVGLHNRSSGLSVLLLRASDFLSEARPIGSWDARRQPCLAHLVLPLPPHLAEELGVLQLGFLTSSVSPVYRPGKPPLIAIAPFIENPDGSLPGADYIITLQGSPAGVRSVVANAPMVKTARSWIREGRARTDFSSAELIEEWKRSFRVFEYIDLDYRPPSAGASE